MNAMLNAFSIVTIWSVSPDTRSANLRADDRPRFTMYLFFGNILQQTFVSPGPIDPADLQPTPRRILPATAPDESDAQLAGS